MDLCQLGLVTASAIDNIGIPKVHGSDLDRRAADERGFDRERNGWPPRTNLAAWPAAIVLAGVRCEGDLGSRDSAVHAQPCSSEDACRLSSGHSRNA